MTAATNQSKPDRDHYGWTQTDENNRREVDRAIAELNAHNAAAGPPPAPKPEDDDDDGTIDLPSRPELPGDDIPDEPDDYVPPPSHGIASAAPNDDEPPFDPDKDDGDRRPRPKDRHADDDNGSGYDDGHYEREDMQHERQQQRAREATRQAVGVPIVSESEGVTLP